MKKIAIVASGLLWATGIFADGVSSQEIVGYQTSKTREFYSLQAASFEGMTGEYSIQQIVPTAQDGVATGGGVFDMQTLNDAGGADEVFVYLTMADDSVKKDGWYNEDMETFATKTFKKGDAFMVNNTTGAGAGLTFSGKVSLGEVVVDLPEFYSIKGNFHPVPISIQDLVPVAPKGTSLGGGVFDMQTLNDAGGAEEVFVYLTMEDDGVKKDGWYNEDMETFATRTFDPAEGFMLNNTTGASAQLKCLTK